jgi:two-component system, chemotaxis family, sensor kinase CheA
VITDITPLLERERAEEEERETVCLVGKLLVDREGVADFLEDAEALVTALHRTRNDETEFRRHVHTLKGNAGLFGVQSVARACHELENELEEVGMDRLTTLVSVEKSVRHFADRGKKFLENGSGDRIVLDEQDKELLLAAIERGESRPNLKKLVESWQHESMRTRLNRAAEQVKALAARLGKDPLNVQVDCEPIRQPHEDWQSLWAQLAHVLRNAVDHGLESPSERSLVGKPEIATVRLAGYRKEGNIVVEVADSGRGVDWAKVEQKALELGLLTKPGVGPEGLSALLFHDGLSTRDQVSDVSGRGVGLGALYTTVKNRGGQIRVESQPGRGTRFVVTWPDAANDNSLKTPGMSKKSA